MGTGLFLLWELPLEIPHRHSDQSCWPAEGELALISPDMSWKWGNAATSPSQQEINAVCFSHMTGSAQADRTQLRLDLLVGHPRQPQGRGSPWTQWQRQKAQRERSGPGNLVTATWCSCVCATGQILVGGQPLMASGSSQGNAHTPR